LRRRSGADQDSKLGATSSSAEGSRIEAPLRCRIDAENIWGCRVRYGEECPLPHWGEVWCPSPENVFILESRSAYFGAFSPRAAPKYLLLHCNIRPGRESRPPVRLPSLTFQADCGSVKGAGVPAEETTEHYLPW